MQVNYLESSMTDIKFSNNAVRVDCRRRKGRKERRKEEKGRERESRD